MGAILEQLEVNSTFFIELALFAALFFILPTFFFRPFQRLIEARHQKTVEDREKAEKLILQANEKLEEYRTKIHAERARVQADLEKALGEAKEQETALLGAARNEAKKISQSTLESLQAQSVALKRSLETDVEGLAHQISDLLMKRQG